ncbi:MAG: VOC family protein [Spirochaetia bacterium]
MKIEHVAIWTKDIERLRSFYMKYFNAKSNDKYTNAAKSFESYFLSFESGTRLELMQMPGIPENKNDAVNQYYGIIHIAFLVKTRQNVLALTDQLQSDGYTVISGPRETGDGYFESCILDPEGNRIEITA